MNIFVKNITDLSIPAACHGRNLANLARDCFIHQQPLTLDFMGIDKLTHEFFQEFLRPLVTLFSNDFLKSQLHIANVSPAIETIMHSSFDTINQCTAGITSYNTKENAIDIYDLNLAWLIKARELAREDFLLAKLSLGIEEDEMQAALCQLSTEDIRFIAQSSLLCFSPRFSSEFIKRVAKQKQQRIDVIDTILGLSGSL